MTDEQQFADIYHEYADKIYRFLVWRTGDADLAEDLVGETFLRAWRSFGRFDGQHAQAWLFQIARNLLTDHWRKRREVPLDETIDRTDEPDIVTTTHARIDQTTEFGRLHAAVSHLPEPHQSVVILRFFQDFSTAEVAETLKLSEANVRVIQYRALQKLKTILSE